MPESEEQIAKNKINNFIDKFKNDPSYHDLACHAAFPLAITPHLLYSLRVECSLEIPWIAVSDLLLSELCKLEDEDIELYRMPTKIKQELLNSLLENDDLANKRITDLSLFLLKYARQQFYNINPKLRNLAKFEYFLALAYIKPDNASNEIIKSLWNAYETKNKQDLVQMNSDLEARANLFPEKFKPFLDYSRRLCNLIDGNIDEPDILTSKNGINYENLQSLLIQRKWKDADEETLNVLLKAAKREEQGWLNLKSIKEIPDDDLQIIDRLWIKYSEDRFGFSKQKLIWKSIKESEETDYITWCCFGNNVGWRVKSNWISWANLDPVNTPEESLEKFPAGHFPALIWWSLLRWDSWWIWGFWLFWRNEWAEVKAFFSRFS